MAISRTVEWKLTCSVDEADRRLRHALAQLDLAPSGPSYALQGSAKRSLVKNRWAAEIYINLAPTSTGAAATCRVDMSAGTKHFEILADIAEAAGDDIFDDRGVSEAVERLGKAARLFGRKEVRHLRNMLRASERVAELGQGQYGPKQGLVVLTDERLFFFEKSMLGNETVEEFSLGSISSISVSKKMTGETLQIHASGNQAEIKSMGHGQGDAVARAFRDVRSAFSQSGPVTAPAQSDDPIAQLERIASLRDRGILTPEEFEAKKAELIARM